MKFIPYIDEIVNNRKNIQSFIEIYPNIFEKNRDKTSALNPVYTNVFTGKKYILNHQNEGFFSEDCKGGLYLFIKDNINYLSNNTLLDEKSRILEVIYNFNGVSSQEAINMYRRCDINFDGSRNPTKVNIPLPAVHSEVVEDKPKILDFNSFKIKPLDTSFLVKKRCISKSVLENPLFDNVKTITENFEGKKLHTTAFLFRNEKGIVGVQKYYYSNQKNKYEKFFLKGSDRQSSLWFAGDKNDFQKMFFFENPIDAISFYELHRKVFVEDKKGSSILLVATGGAYAQEQLQYIKEVIKNNPNEIDAFLGNDNDEKGKQFNEKLRTLFHGITKVKRVNEVVSRNKDFNADLQQKKRILQEQM